MSAFDAHVRRISRREMLAIVGAAGAAAACGGSEASPVSPTPTTTTTTTSPSAACAVSPSETVGPYPSLTDLIRSAIREGKSGTPVTLTITVVNVNGNCAPVANAMVDVWQCDAEGHYSQYSQPGYNGTSQTFLRGIQTTDSLAAAHAGYCSGPAVEGSVISKTAPPSLYAVMVPPCRSTIVFTIERPRPLPPAARREASTL